MFGLFRKKRIDQYTQGATGYVTRTYKPVPKLEGDSGIKYSLFNAGSGVKYSERSGVQYSLQETDADIPAKGDQFQKAAVEQLFALGLRWDCVDFEHGSLLINKQLQKEKKVGDSLRTRYGSDAKG